MEKRRYQRLPSDIKLSYTIIARVDSTPFEFGNSVTIDIGPTGLAMLVDEPIPIPMLLQLQIRPPGSASSLFLLGKSTYCTPVEDIGMYRVGIKFVGMLPPEMDSLIQEIRGSEGISSTS